MAYYYALNTDFGALYGILHPKNPFHDKWKFCGKETFVSQVTESISLSPISISSSFHQSICFSFESVISVIIIPVILGFPLKEGAVALSAAAPFDRNRFHMLLSPICTSL